METPLATQMIEYADKKGWSNDHPMRVKAIEFDSVAVDYSKGNVSAKKMMGAWARARRCWCDYTGEPLI